MATRQSSIILGRIGTLFNEGRVGSMTDEQLLERFAARRAQATEAAEAAEAAFEVLVLRHGPMVLGVCRRLLRDPHDFEDAFQATFLILARRAGAIRKRDAVGGWLRKVAHRVAIRARELSVRRVALDSIDPASSAEGPGMIVEREDLCTAVLDEVQLLPEKYRLPVQLCYIEGQTHDEAARRLAWPVGTVRTRLAWARNRLRDRLTRRGLALPAGLIGTWLVSSKASAGVPAALVKTTVEAAAGRAVGRSVISLAEGMMRAMLMSKIKLVIFVILGTGSLAGTLLPFTRAQVGKSGQAGQSQLSRPAGPRVEAQKEAAITAAREVRTVFFRVVDHKTKQPLSSVMLKVWVNGKMTREQITDESGRMVIPLPEKEFERLTITARGNGLVPMRVYLRHIAAKETEIPRSYTLAMERGTSIGGIVRDEEGRPIEGVTVGIYETSPEDRGREALDFDEITARSDSQGRWHLDLIPAKLDLSHLHFRYSHPEFLSPIDAINIQASEAPEQLRAWSSVTVLRRGISVAGRVLERDGRPITGASVRLGNHFWNPDMRTDAAGRFRFRNAAEGESFLTVQAAGHAPEARPVRVRFGLPSFEFRLGPGRTIRGRVIDSKGRPVAGAGLYVSQWGGRHTLDWRGRTNEEGRFGWDSVPNDPVTLGASKEGYRDTVMTIELSNNEHVLTLLRANPLRIWGTVTDDDSGRPVETFTVVPGTRIGGPTPLWMVNFAKTHHGGLYEFSFASLGTQPHMVRIEAKGYLSAVSPAHQNDTGDHVFDVRLRKGAWLEGLIGGLDGAPLADAEVVVATGEGIHISGGKADQRDYHPHLLTGPDGRFAFSPPEGPYRIIALHDRGYAEASAQQLAELHALTIEPWGRIEGSLRVGGQALAHETVVASLDDDGVDPEWMRIQNESRAQTDGEGRFVVERVTPGEARVHWQPADHGERAMPDRYYQPVFVNVLAGQLARVDLVQAGGRPLLGRIIDPNSGRWPLDLAKSNAYLLPKMPVVPYPADLAEGERRLWLHRWRLTEAVKDYRQRRRGFAHSLKLQPDGSFRVDEVQPGSYELHVRIKGFAELIRDVTVPEPTAGQAGAPVDLGTLALKR